MPDSYYIGEFFHIVGVFGIAGAGDVVLDRDVVDAPHEDRAGDCARSPRWPSGATACSRSR